MELNIIEKTQKNRLMVKVEARNLHFNEGLHKCAYWVERTALAQYLKKGTQVFAEGQPEVSTYKAQDGSQRAELKCRVLNIQLLGSQTKESGSSSNSGTESTTPAYEAAPNANNPADDDLPF